MSTATAVVVPDCIVELTADLLPVFNTLWDGDDTVLAELVADDAQLEQAAKRLLVEIMDQEPGYPPRTAIKQFSKHQSVQIGALREAIIYYAHLG